MSRFAGAFGFGGDESSSEEQSDQGDNQVNEAVAAQP